MEHTNDLKKAWFHPRTEQTYLGPHRQFRHMAEAHPGAESQTAAQGCPRPDMENHQKVANLIRRYGQDWILDDNLMDICEALDSQRVPIRKTWPSRSDGQSHSWSRAGPFRTTLRWL